MLSNEKTDYEVMLHPLNVDEVRACLADEKNRNKPGTIKTGFVDFDYRMGGLRRGEVYLLAARPEMGKTALAVNIMKNVALDHGGSVAYYAPGNSESEIIQKLLYSMEIDKNTYPTTQQENADLPDQSVFIQLEKASIYLNDTKTLEAGEIRTSLEQLERQIDLVIIDDLQSLYLEEYADEFDKEKMALQLMRDIAENRDCAVLVLCQLKRSKPNMKNSEPKMCDLFYPKIERFVDHILFLHKDECYEKKSETKEIVHIIIAKTAHAGPSVVCLGWMPAQQRFCSL